MSPHRLLLPVAASASEGSAPDPAPVSRSRERQRVVRPLSPSWAT